MVIAAAKLQPGDELRYYSDFAPVLSVKLTANKCYIKAILAHANARVECTYRVADRVTVRRKANRAT